MLPSTPPVYIPGDTVVVNKMFSPSKSTVPGSVAILNPFSLGDSLHETAKFAA